MRQSLEKAELTQKFMESYYKRINLTGGEWRLKDMREDIVKFSKFMIGVSPRDYQVLLWDMIDKEDKLAVIKARQIGFSTGIALYCLWYAWFNKHPTGVNNDTKICIISKDDDASKKIIQQIKDFMYSGDKHMSNFLKGNKAHTTTLFSSQITTNNTEMLKLKNGSVIYSFPPTGKVRGTSNDILFIDEFAFLNTVDKERFFYTDALPSISQTNGKIIISSTPNGYGDLFYSLVDPDEKEQVHIFKRYAFPYFVNKDEGYQNQVLMLKETIDESQFKQEYECDFTQNSVSFFNSLKVKACFDENLVSIPIDEPEYVAGVDYGMTESRTVITLCTLIDGKIHRLYFKEFDSGYDNNGIIPFMRGLMDRFKINKIVVDDCPMGDVINRQMIELGWNVELFSFNKDKEKYYCAFRNRMNKGEIKMIYDNQTEKQMLELIQEETKTGRLDIHKPRRGRDDIVASLVMAAKTFLDVNKEVRLYLA